MHTIREIQAKLIDLKYLPEEAPDGTSNIDGIPGQRTFDAFNHYLAGQNKPPIVLADFTIERLNADLWPGEQPAAPAPASNPITDFFTGLAIQAALNALKGLPIVTFLSGYKTYIVGIVCILTGIIAMLGWAVPPLPALDAGAGLQLVLTGLGFLGLRAAVAKTGA